MKTVDHYIEVIKNVVSYELCDAILKEYENDSSWDDACIANNIVDINKRNCEIIGISHSAVINKNEQLRKHLDNNLKECASNVIQFYSKKHSVFCVMDTGYDLLRYKEGGFFKTHIDEGPKYNRTVSCSLILNDDYEGGEFAFFDRQIKFTPKKGDALMFPSNYIYPHEIMPVTKGTRYSIVTWFI